MFRLPNVPCKGSKVMSPLYSSVQRSIKSTRARPQFSVATWAFRLVAFSLLVLTATPALAQTPWPAETRANAINLTPIEGPGENDFHSDLSAAVWNPLTQTLWLGRNGPGASGSKLWAVVDSAAGGFEIRQGPGGRSEWTGFGDLEGVTQADFAEEVVYVIVEGIEQIREYDISTPGTQVLNNTWNTRPHLPVNGGKGAEGITFVPDTALFSVGFVDRFGNPYLSSGGMGGLMFVGHQNGGSIFVFDLNRSNSTFVFVGEYETPHNEVAGLEFDRSSGELFVWHDAGHDILSVLDLASVGVVPNVRRRFNELGRFDGPNSANNEGIAIVPISDCVGGSRDFFMTTDDGEEDSLRWYREFTHGCSVCESDTDEDGICDTVDNCTEAANATQTDSDLDGYGNACDPDSNNDGLIGGPDHNAFALAFGTLCGEPGFDPALDFNEDCAIGGPDFTTFRAHFGEAPGPSALTCAGTVPCP